MEKKLRVSRIEIRNVMGIREAEIAPGAVTLIQGANGQGKTSAMEAIKSVLEGGHDATLLARGEESGEVVLVLDDETEIRKRITADRSTVTVTRPDVGKVGSPQTYIRALTDALSANPVELIQSDGARAAELVLESVPMEIGDDDVFPIVEPTGVEIPNGDLKGHALKALARVRQRVYDERTGVNREAKGKKATVDQLSASLSDESESREDVDAEITRLEAENEGSPEEVRQEVARLREQASMDADEAAKPYIAEIEDLQAKIDQLKSERDAAVEKVGAALESEVNEIESAERARKAAATERLKSLRAEKETRVKEANTRETVDGLRSEVETLTSQSEALTAAIEGLDALKLRLTKKLPVPGLEVRDDGLYFEDVPWKRVNTASKVKVALRLATLRAGTVPLICLDGLETLDEETFGRFVENAAKLDGLQFVVTRVGSGDLSIRSLPEPEVAGV